MSRKKIPISTQTEVLTRSRRRCAICFGLNGDTEKKVGQIAHLDHNPSNNSIENLVFLCLGHHDQYDSKTSQSKNLTLDEVKAYRKELYALMDKQMQLSDTSLTAEGAPPDEHPAQEKSDVAAVISEEKESVRVRVQVTMTGVTYEVRVPLDAQVCVVLTQLTSKLGVPRMSPAGIPVSYYLFSKARNARLNASQTFRENGVTDGETFNIVFEGKAG